MKKLTALALSLMMALTIAACYGGYTMSTPPDGVTDFPSITPDIMKKIVGTMERAEELPPESSYFKTSVLLNFINCTGNDSVELIAHYMTGATGHVVDCLGTTTLFYEWGNIWVEALYEGGLQVTGLLWE